MRIVIDKTSVRAWTALLLGLAAAACGGSSGSGQRDAAPVFCVPGAMVSCHRVDCDGAQVCLQDGSGYGACVCASPSDAAVPDAATPDAPAADAAIPDAGLPDAPAAGDAAPAASVIVFADSPADPNGARQIYRMAADGAGVVQLTSTGGLDNDEPALSPDRLTIAFASKRDFPEPDGGGVMNPTLRLIYLMDADGANARRLTANAPDMCSEHNPRFSHDGQWITFSMSCTNVTPSDIFRVYRIAIDGTQQKKYAPSQSSIISGANHTYPVFAPDDASIFFLAEVSSINDDVFNITVDGATTKRLSHCNGSARSARGTPMPSPDGALVYFVSGDNSFSGDQLGRVEQVALDGTGQATVFAITSLTTPDDYAGSPQDFDLGLTPDGARFVFATYTDTTVDPPTSSVATAALDGTGRATVHTGGFAQQPDAR